MNSILNDRFLTVRSVYYQNVNLFKSQQRIQKILSTLSLSLNTTFINNYIRHSLKGLYLSSSIKFQLIDGNLLVGSDDNSNFIPNFNEIISISFAHDINFVLVIEKDTIFNLLKQFKFSVKSRHGLNLILTVND